MHLFCLAKNLPRFILPNCFQPILQLQNCAALAYTDLSSIAELVLLYNAEMLKATLADPATQAVLTTIGYPVSKNLHAMLCYLLNRFGNKTDFPHEIGFFLGYPPDDVIGFIAHKGNHCKLCGIWKVYSDVERACTIFSEYQNCKVFLLSALERGSSIFDCILPAKMAV